MNLRKNSNRILPCTLSLFLLASGAAFAQPGGGQSGPPQSPGVNHDTLPGTVPEATAGISGTDRLFVKEALQGGMAEVELGQLAAEKGASDDVKQFGQQMVEDHGKLGDKMREVASQVDVKPPDSISGKDRALKVKLQALSGEEFDKAYIRAMVKDHKKDLDDFKIEASNGASPVKDAATQGQEIIAHHLEMIRQIAEVHGVADTKSSGKSGQ